MKPAGRTAPTDGPARALHAAARIAFDEAARAVGRRPQVSLEIGGAHVTLVGAGDAVIEQIRPALAHLEVASGPADLLIEVWDSQSTHTAMARCPWSPDAFVARAEIADAGPDTGIFVSYNAGSGLLSVLDVETGIGMVWIRDATALPYYEAAAPLRTVLHWWFSRRGMHLVHAAALGQAGDAVLLGGRGGSGKSTTALIGLLSGLDFLGDDYVLCAADAVHSLYATAKLDAGSLERVPDAQPLVMRSPGSPGEKSVLHLHPRFADRLPRSARLRAIVIPKVCDVARSRLSLLGPAAAFLELAPTTVFQLPGAHATTTGFLRALVTGLPCYRLELGPDRTDPPKILAGLLQELAP